MRQKEGLYAVWHRLRPVRDRASGKKPYRRTRCSFIRRVYGEAERAALSLDEPLPAGRSAAHRLASAAANFAAKEAFLKAAGTGLREPFSLCEIEAVRLESGAPAYHFSGQTAEWMQAHGLAARLSLSHEGGMALAFCILETL